MKNDLAKFRLLEKNAQLASLRSVLREAIDKTDNLLTLRWNTDADGPDHEELFLRRNLDLLEAYKEVVNTWEGQVELALKALESGEKSDEKEVK